MRALLAVSAIALGCAGSTDPGVDPCEGIDVDCDCDGAQTVGSCSDGMVTCECPDGGTGGHIGDGDSSGDGGLLASGGLASSGGSSGGETGSGGELPGGGGAQSGGAATDSGGAPDGGTSSGGESSGGAASGGASSGGAPAMCSGSGSPCNGVGDRTYYCGGEAESPTCKSCTPGWCNCEQGPTFEPGGPQEACFYNTFPGYTCSIVCQYCLDDPEECP